jgi:hypothetical protein
MPFCHAPSSRVPQPIQTAGAAEAITRGKLVLVTRASSGIGRDGRKVQRVAEEIEFYSRASGELGKKEDWYTLVVPGDSKSPFVEHTWRYQDADEKIETSSGKLDVSILYFLSKEYPEDAKAKLRSLLAAKSLGLPDD